MNRFFITILFTLLAATHILPLDAAMKRTREENDHDNRPQQRQRRELSSGLPNELRRLCLKAMIDVDTPENLLASLIKLCDATIDEGYVAIIAPEVLLADILTER